MAKKRTYEKKPFESDCSNSDTSANLYMSMAVSKAYKSLSPKQQQLYLYCKLQYYGEKSKSKPDPFKEQIYFTMNKSKWCSLYGLYSTNDSAGFTRDITALIEKGFIKCISCGKSSRTKGIYTYSSMWQKYGTSDFIINLSDMTSSMIQKRNKKA